MKRYSLPLWVPLVILYIVGIAGFWVPIWIPDGIKEQWIGFAGSLLSTAVSIAAVIVAWLAVRRQVRTAIISREEERLEKALPGLYDAMAFCSKLQPFRELRGTSQVLVAFQTHGVGMPDSTMEKDIDVALPLTDSTTKRSVTAATHFAYRRARSAAATGSHLAQINKALMKSDECSQDSDDWMPPDLYNDRVDQKDQLTVMLIAQIREFHEAVDTIGSLTRNISNTIMRYEARRIRIRAEIERYFGDEE